MWLCWKRRARLVRIFSSTWDGPLGGWNGSIWGAELRTAGARGSRAGDLWFARFVDFARDDRSGLGR